MGITSLVSRIWVAIAVVIGLELVALSPLRVRLMLVASFGVAALLVVAQRRRLLAPSPFLRPLAVGFVLSLLPVVSLAVFPDADPLARMTAELLPTMTGWCVLLSLLLTGTDADEVNQPERDIKVGRWRGAVVLALTFLLLAVVHQVAVGDLALVADEVVYLTQARWMEPGRWTATVDPDIAKFFVMRQIDYLDGQLIGQYPAGWPMILAAFRMIGLEWWSGVILGTASVALVYLLGARLHSRRMGVIAAVLLATSQDFVVGHAGYMSHAATFGGCLGGALLLLQGIDQSGWRRWLLWAGAGALLGFVVAVRPLTGLAIGTSIGVWMLVRAWQADRRAPLVMAACVAVGGIVPASLFIAHNLSVFGEPLALGYDVIHRGLHSPGFGTKGYMALDANVDRVPVTFPFTPMMAVENLVARFAGVNTSFLPIGMLLPVAAAAIAAGFRISWPLLALFSLLPAVQFFFWSPQLRMYFELLPFLLLAVAAMLVTIRSRWPRLATALIAMLIIMQGVLVVPADPNKPAGHRPWGTSDYGPIAHARPLAFRSVDSLARAHEKILLFSREASRYDNLIDRLYIFNEPGFNGRIVVARDRGAINQDLMRRYPEHVPVLVEDRHGQTPAVFTQLARPAPRAVQ